MDNRATSQMDLYNILLTKSTSDNLEVSAVVQKVYEKLFHGKLKAGPSFLHINQDELLNIRTNLAKEIAATDDDVWIFGYGSLMWKADFPYIDRRCGFICGYSRYFYQNSIDHRGTHTKPGRVVTLLPTGVPSDRVYGVAYRIAAEHKDNVVQHLDYREKNGYERCTLKFYEFPESKNSSFDIIMYIATKENGSYAGNICQLAKIAEQIFTSAGPSGPNRDYLFNLAYTMRMLFPGVKDEHLFSLEKEVLRRIELDEDAALERAIKKKLNEILLSKNLRNEVHLVQAVQQMELLRKYCDKPGWRERLLTDELLTKST